MESFTEIYLRETRRIVEAIDGESVERLAEGLAHVRDRSGRLFILGVGGSAGHASHAVNDFRKLCGFEAYTPVDNVSELSARINDDGWETCFSDWLEGSHLSARDGILVFSVGGGDRERGISTNIVNALDAARSSGCFIGGVVGRDGGHTGALGALYFRDEVLAVLAQAGIFRCHIKRVQQFFHSPAPAASPSRAMRICRSRQLLAERPESFGRHKSSSEQA